MKKTRGEKSRDTVPLKILYQVILFLYPFILTSYCVFQYWPPSNVRSFLCGNLLTFYEYKLEPSFQINSFLILCSFSDKLSIVWVEDELDGDEDLVDVPAGRGLPSHRHHRLEAQVSCLKWQCQEIWTQNFCCQPHVIVPRFYLVNRIWFNKTIFYLHRTIKNRQCYGKCHLIMSGDFQTKIFI
jgi:hypothetical protein